MSANPKSIPETELLVPFESQALPTHCKEYYTAKRQNFFASIQGFREIWDCYMLFDKILLLEFEDLKAANTPSQLFPLLLYFNAHAKIRVSFELALSGCMAEARSILRDAIEFVAHAHHILRDPALQITWLNKNDELKAFKDAFERDKKEKLFKGLDELHKVWGQLSETGSHATINAICDRFKMSEDDKSVSWRLNYCGIEQDFWEKSLFHMLLTFSTVERTLFCDYESRLQFDESLLQLRHEFDARKEKLRKTIIARYKIPPPNVAKTKP